LNTEKLTPVYRHLPSILGLVGLIFGLVEYFSAVKLRQINWTLEEEIKQQKTNSINVERSNHIAHVSTVGGVEIESAPLTPQRANLIANANSEELPITTAPWIEEKLPVSETDQEASAGNGNAAMIEKETIVSSEVTRGTKTNSQAMLESAMCANHLRQIAIAAQAWSERNGGFAPSDFAMIASELAPMILVCPSDHANDTWTTSWDDFDMSRITYKMHRSSPMWGRATGFVTCPIHHYNLMANGFIMRSPRPR
jgi:hypothetical protein